MISEEIHVYSDLITRLKAYHCHNRLCVCVCILIYRSIRVQVQTESIFVRNVEVPEETTQVVGYFHTRPQDIDDVQDLDLGAIQDQLLDLVENFNTRGSGFIMDHIRSFTICITVNKPLAASSYIPTPAKLAKKCFLVNVKNTDNKCFLWSVISSMIQPPRNPNRVSWYTGHANKVNIDGLEFPMPVKDIPKFEELNSDISVNVHYYDDDSNDFKTIYLSPHKDRHHPVNLLFLVKDNNTHHTWIKNMSVLVAHGSKKQHKLFVCNSCIRSFTSQRVLDAHVPGCNQNETDYVPTPELLKKRMSGECTK